MLAASDFPRLVLMLRAVMVLCHRAVPGAARVLVRSGARAEDLFIKLVARVAGRKGMSSVVMRLLWFSGLC